MKKKEVKSLFKNLLNSNEKIISVKYEGKKSAASQWHRLKNVWTMLWRGGSAEIIKKLPPCRFKNFLYRRMGLKIGKNVLIFPNIDLSPSLGELITLEDNVILGVGCSLIVDALTQDKITLGKVHIKKNAVIGGKSFVGLGVTVGENAIVANCACVTKDVGDYEVVGGVPAKLIRKRK
ncbi:hypothetical protein CEE44_04735 [Candidatus Woesearchaeota archaeon B3_Woes]|nr:MAG: hypothetical protein CEE44_04735 [Candidatus Woesearchaeota archaeon B3_Woes]